MMREPRGMEIIINPNWDKFAGERSAFLPLAPKPELPEKAVSPGGKQGEEEIEYDPEPLEEDVYGVGITSLLRDARRLALHQGSLLRFARSSVTLLLLWGTMFLQIFMVCEFKILVTQGYVHRIRWTYSEYEVWMYENHTWLTPNGFDRGIEGYFNAQRFNDLPEHIDKDMICAFPLSRPSFYGSVLAVWAFTVVIDIRKIFYYMDLMLLRMDVVDSAENMLIPDEANKTVTLAGLTVGFKAFLFFWVFLPRILIDLYLLWLGSRWLTATPSFGDLLMNAMGLEFILLLKDLIYNAVVPGRVKFETKNFLVPIRRKQQANWSSYLGGFLWLLGVLIWVMLYMYRLQAVLPDYKFDIASVCREYLAEQTALTRPDGSALLLRGHPIAGASGRHRR